MNRHKLTTAIKVAAICMTGVLVSSTAIAAPSEETFSDISKALENPLRPSSDLKLDPLRKPLEVLTFFQIEKGMHVLDVFSGPGYYSEILNHLVGSRGSVTMYNHLPWVAYSKKASDIRVANGRLENATTKYEDIGAVDFNKNKYDAALIILGLHDLYHKSEKNTDGSGLDAKPFLKSLYNSIKPGGVVGVIEHEADPSSDPFEVADKTERLSSKYVLELMTGAGFVLEAQSSMLRNNFDDYSKSVFAPEVRRRTDRAVLRFRKVK